MKTIIQLLFLILIYETVYAAPRLPRNYKVSTTIYDKELDSNAFAFKPTPLNCELHLVSSNMLVWVMHRESEYKRSYLCDTTIYVQDRKDQVIKHIVKFGGRKMPEVIGVSLRGSVLFEGEEEILFGGDESNRAREKKKTVDFFLPDIRKECPFIIESVTAPSVFTQRFKEDNKPSFTMLVFKKNKPKVMKEVTVTAVPTDKDPMWEKINKGFSPPSSWLRKLWPVIDWNKNGFIYWNGYDWKKFKWDAN